MFIAVWRLRVVDLGVVRQIACSTVDQVGSFWVDLLDAARGDGWTDFGIGWGDWMEVEKSVAGHGYRLLTST
jgi:hypothetical protein